MIRAHGLSTNAALILGLTALACTGADTGGQAEAMPSNTAPTVVASGLNGPMGVTVDDDGTIWVIDSGVGGDQALLMPLPGTDELAEIPFGETARVVRVDPSGTQTDVVSLPSVVLPEGANGGGRLAILDGVLYATSGGWAAGSGDRLPNMATVIRIDGEQVTEIVNTWDIESSQNPAGALVETNPYGLAASPDGMLWMTDAAGNTLFRVDPQAGSLELVAVFDALPGPIPNPARGGAMEIEPVPTAVAFMGGEMYVSLLPGFPFPPGSARVVRVSASGEITDYASDLTMLTDLQAGPDGNLYAVSMGFFTEQGPTPESGSVIRIGQGASSETILSGLAFPTAIAFDGAGNAYVTRNGVGAPGSGEVIRYPGLIDAGG